MFRKYFFNGLAAGLFSGTAAFFYYKVYIISLEISYTGIVSPTTIVSASLFAGMLIAWLSYALDQAFKKPVLTNFLLTTGTVVSLIIPFMISLPLDVAHPELFPGLVVPIQLFPVLGWFMFNPLFRKCLTK